jgi:hypothetical protein
MLFDKLKDTTLKSLKFGGTGTRGDSVKPYIVTDINTANVSDPSVQFDVNNINIENIKNLAKSGIQKAIYGLTKFDDGFIRGGIGGAVKASIIDTLRIDSFLSDPMS